MTNQHLPQLVVITSDQHLQAAQKYLAAAREQIALAQAQVLHLQEQVTTTVARQEQTSPPLAITVAAAATALGLNHSAIYKLLMRGERKSVKVGKRRIIPMQELQNFLERGLEDGF